MSVLTTKYCLWHSLWWSLLLVLATKSTTMNSRVWRWPILSVTTNGNSTDTMSVLTTDWEEETVWCQHTGTHSRLHRGFRNQGGQYKRYKDCLKSTMTQFGISAIEALLQTAQLRWCGHVIRMDNTRIPKQVFYGQLHHGFRHPGGQ